MSRRASVPALEPVEMSTQLVEEIVGGLELVPEGRLDEHHARALDERIRLTAGTVRDRLTRLSTLVEQAKAGEVWDVLGFASWTAYLADALGGQLHLPSGERRELVALLAGEGMSTRAMAPIVGASPRTVARDVETLDLPGVPGDTPAAVVGLDGKAYTPKRGKRFEGEHIVTRSAEPIAWPENLAWMPKDIYTFVCTCGYDCDSEGVARRHCAENGGGRVQIAEQGTIEGTEPERMVPTLPGLGLSQQIGEEIPPWRMAYYGWVTDRLAADTPDKRAAFEAGWLAHEASISSHV